MLKIRFQRIGKKNRPHFRLILTESRAAAKKKAKEILGFWDPLKKKGDVKAERVKYWLGIGAQPSDTAYNFLVSRGIIRKAKIQVHKKKKETKGIKVKAAIQPEVTAPPPAT